MSEKKLFKTFVQDSRNFIDNLIQIVDELSKNPGNTELILQAYRNAHSLKSEAAFLKEEEIVEISHAMESIFEKYKNHGTFIIKHDLDKITFSIERVNEILDYYNETTSENKNATEKTGESGGVEYTDIMSMPSITSFEKTLLREARERNEKFYRITFEIAEDCPMKYAKAFLVISNLEMLVNVIRTVPAFGEEKESLYRKMSIYFTSSVTEKEIYGAVNIDQVISISLAPLSFDVFLKDSSWDKVRKRKNDIIKVDTDKLDQITNYIDEIKIDIHRLMKNLPKIDKQGTFKKSIERIKEYSLGLEEVVKEIEMIPLIESFSFFSRYVRDLAKQIGKRAELFIEGNEVKVSRKAGEIISEIVIHLLRNAVDHGIETEEERASVGKNPAGKIYLKVERVDDYLKISVEDDGRGINREKVSSRLTSGEVDLIKDDDLLKILIQTGYSTKDKPDSISGRGIGLDVVAHKISQLQGGKLLLDSSVHEGTRFTLIIPGGFALTSFQLVKTGTLLIAVPTKNIQKIIDIQMEDYSTDSNGSLLLSGVPVYSTEGRILGTDQKPSESKGIYLNYLGKTGIFLIDEILFEKSLSEQNLTLVIEENQYLYKVMYGDTYADYLYLNPAIVAE